MNKGVGNSLEKNQNQQELFKGKLLLLRDMLLADQYVIDDMSEEESVDYLDCVDVFLQSSDQTIMEASLATRFLITKKVKERVKED